VDDVRPGEFINVERIEFIVTYRCNSHCKHCSVGQDKRASSPVAVDVELAVQIVDRVAQAYSPQSVMTFGGEPLLFPDTVCAIHAAARANQIPSREIITNAGWPRSEGEFQAVASKLSDSGVTSMAISVDGFHQEYVPTDVLERNVRALVDSGTRLGWNPCWVISREHENPWNERTRSVLRNLSHLPVPESYGNVVQPAGNALVWLHDFMPSRMAAPEGTCEDVPYGGRLDNVTGISVEPDGSICVCNELSIGNANQRDVLDIIHDYDPYRIPEMNAILQGGTTALAELACNRGVLPDPGGYYSICGMCIDLRRRLA
jgi:hypothetical protein